VSVARPFADGPARRLLVLAVLATAAVLLAQPARAMAGQASTGTLLFYPCTNCHPVTLDAAGKPNHPLPIAGFKGHEIKLESHDVLGAEACLVCHDDAEHNPGMLHAVDGTLIDVKTGDIALLCEKCHFQKYTEFKQGTHGKHFASCVVAGCHDPHSPAYIYISPLKPFFGTGFQIKAVGFDRVPLTPVMPPPVTAPTTTPLWYLIVSGVGLFLVLVIVVRLAAPAVMERLKR
jgi:hypothetical protein